MSKLYISNRQETEQEIADLHVELFNKNADSKKIFKFMKLCEIARGFTPSERCKGKKCVIGLSCGNLDAKIMFVAEAPGRNGAERTGIPIYGDPTGDNFEQILFLATDGKINRKDVFITNTFLWNPINNRGLNDKPSPTEIQKGIPFLEQTIKIVQPELVIALGKTAYNTLRIIGGLPISDTSLKNTIGSLHEWKDRFLSVMYHPSPRVIGTYRSLEQMGEDLRYIIYSWMKSRKSK